MQDAVASLRRFNRFFTRHVGALDAQFLDSELTLPEARVLYEVATRAPVLASDIGAALGIDAGYLSRIVRRFLARGLIARERGTDARERPIVLTAAGRAAFEDLDARQRHLVEASLADASEDALAELMRALDTVRAVLADTLDPVTIRDFRDGDMGRIIAAQSRYYAEVHAWSGGMEALMLDVAATFLRSHVPGRTNCWVAERSGALLGSVFLLDAGSGVAQLRLLHVEAAARGTGLGSTLIARCVDLARSAGYRQVMLWTHSVLLPARRRYEAAGFRLVSTEIHEEFGVPVEGETWVLELHPLAPAGEARLSPRRDSTS